MEPDGFAPDSEDAAGCAGHGPPGFGARIPVVAGCRRGGRDCFRRDRRAADVSKRRPGAAVAGGGGTAARGSGVGNDRNEEGRPGGPPHPDRNLGIGRLEFDGYTSATGGDIECGVTASGGALDCEGRGLAIHGYGGRAGAGREKDSHAGPVSPARGNPSLLPAAAAGLAPGGNRTRTRALSPEPEYSIPIPPASRVHT